MKTIIITGANGNLGLAVTRKILESGHRVIATVINEAGRKDISASPNLEVEVVNLADEGETASFISRILSAYGQVDAAIMLVGGFAAGNIAATSSADISRQVSLNFDTAYHVTRPLFQQMIRNNSGRLVFIGARPALDPHRGKDLLAYALGKSLLFTLASFLNEEARGKNVVATIVVPSTIDTNLNRQSMPDANPADWVKPGQLADIIDFIVSEKAEPLRETTLKVYNNA